jgi:hypothetical protein
MPEPTQVPAQVPQTNFLSRAIVAVNSFLVANPVIKNLLGGVLHAGTIGAVAYIATMFSPANVGVITATGILGAFGAAVKAYAQHQADLYQQAQNTVVAK